MKIDILSLLTDTSVWLSFVFLFSVLLIIYSTIKSMKMPGNKGIKFSLITTFILLIWFFAVVILGKLGIFAQNQLFVPNILIGFLILFQLLRMAYYSETIKKIFEVAPLHWIMGIQIYRLLGIVFLILWSRGILPGAFAFPSGIGDIIVGISAPFVAIMYFLKKSYSRKLAIIWNILGIVDLVIALSVGFLGFPRPIQFVPLNPSTEPLSLFPLAIIPLFSVPLALLLHFLSLRVLMKKKDLKNEKL